MKKALMLATSLILISCQSQIKVSSADITSQTSLEHPFIHSAYFWFTEDASEEAIAAFKVDAEKLADIETVRAFYSGQPANTDRPVIENTYDYAIVFHFENLEDQDYYQKHSVHLEMIEKHEHLWEKVMVTDIEH